MRKIFKIAPRRKPIVTSTTYTFGEIYRLAIAERKKRISYKTVKGYECAYKHCHMLSDMRITDIKVKHLQSCVNAISAGQPTQKRVRQLMHNVYNYAVKYQIISPMQDISKYVDIAPHKVKYKKTPFTTRQINRIRKLDNDLYARATLILIYTGLRIGELLALRKSDVRINQRYFVVRHAKTVAGTNRIVPISHKVLPYFMYFMQSDTEYLLGDNIPYSRFLRHFQKLMRAIHTKHTPHECRHTFATMLDNTNANKIAVKRILGHATRDITDGVYTHKDLRQLKKAIDLL